MKKSVIICSGFILAAQWVCTTEAKSVNIAKAIYGTKTRIEQKNKAKGTTAQAVDGRYEDNSSIQFSGVPAKLILNFPQQYNVSRVRIYPGMLIYANYPSGECGIKSYRIEGLINGGWKLLAAQQNAPSYKKSGHSGNKKHFYEHKFNPIKIEALRLVVLESGFTGKTSNSNGKVVVAPKNRQSFLREIEVFQDGNNIQTMNFLSDKIEADFRLPVYRDQKSAKLVIINKNKRLLNLKLTVKNEKISDKILLDKIFKLTPGKNEIEIDISKFKNGRYLTSLHLSGKKSSLKGQVVRLLRIDRLPAAVLPDEPVNVTDRKVFPFDNFYVAKRSGVKNKLVQAKVHQASGLLAPNRIRQRAWHMNFDKKDNLVIKFFDETRSGKDRKYHYAWSKDLKNWQIGDIPPTGKEVRNPESPQFPVEVQPRWRVSAKNDENVFRFYDPKRDKKPELNQIFVKYSSVKKVKWGKIDIPYRSTFAVWQKKNKDVILLDKKPLLVDRVSFMPDELEQENFTNDNFAQQYLGEKGKILYYPRGAMVRRFKPFVAEYDNLSQGFRLMKIFYTKDGFNWKQTFFTLPTVKDSWGYQHYGANILRIPNANLFIAYLYVYDVSKQQVYLEINYSRDGLRWERMPDQPAFVANSELGQWTSGMVFLDGRHIERNGVYYHVMGHTTSALHFYSACYRDDTSGINSKALKRRFQSRDLEKWPYFKSIGGWSGLAKNMLQAHASTGVLTFRKDSWIGIEAEKSGKLVSRILQADNCQLVMNAKVNKGGWIKVEVLTADSQNLPMYSGENAAIVTTDSTAADLTWSNGKVKNLPNLPFRLKISMNKATLYTMNFVNKERFIVNQDFDDKKIFNVKTERSVKNMVYWRMFQPGIVEIVPEKDDNQAVLLTRVDRKEGLSMRGFKVGKNKDYQLIFSMKRYPKGTFVVSFDSFLPKSNIFAIYTLPNGKVYVKSGKKKPYYYPTSINTEPNQWYKIFVDFNSKDKTYSITVIDSKGNEQKSKRKIILPLVEKINMISFRPAPGVANKTLIDSIKLREK